MANSSWQSKKNALHIVKDGLHTSILERFQKDQRFRESQTVHNWCEAWCVEYLHYLVTVDTTIKHHVNNVDVTTICGDLSVDRQTST